MTIDCAELHACADLLHEEGARLMEQTRSQLTHPGAVAQLQLVAEIEEVAAKVEARIGEACPGDQD